MRNHLLKKTPNRKGIGGWVLVTVGAWLAGAILPCGIPLVVNKSTHLIISSTTEATLSEVEK